MFGINHTKLMLRQVKYTDVTLYFTENNIAKSSSIETY